MKNIVNKTSSKILISAAFALFMFSTASFAQNRPPQGKPPQEAIDACVDKSEGESVSFETRRGDTLEGVCKVMEDTLVAVPLDHEDRQ